MKANIREWGVLRRGENGHIWWATVFLSEEEARNYATPLDSVEYRWVTQWQDCQANP